MHLSFTLIRRLWRPLAILLLAAAGALNVPQRTAANDGLDTPALPAMGAANAIVAPAQQAPPADASVGAYDFTVIAQTGDAGITAFGVEDGKEYVSINDNGKVAFVARAEGGQGVFVGDGSEVVGRVSFPASSVRTYAPTVKITRFDTVVAIDKNTADPGNQLTTLREWYVGGGSHTILEAVANPPQDICPTTLPVPQPAPGCPIPDLCPLILPRPLPAYSATGLGRRALPV